MASIENKVFWITGASSGIGEGLVKVLAPQNVKLILSSRRLDALEEVKAQCPHQENVKILTIDLSKPETLEAKTNEALALFGRIDIVIHSGGISQRSYAMDTDIEVSRRLMEVNFFSTIILTKNLLLSMQKNGFGHIVIISSLAGKFGNLDRSSYAASKHALHGYYESLREELYKTGIYITIVIPGFIKTNISLNALTEKGDKFDKIDAVPENGISAEDCSKQIIKAITKQNKEVRIGGKELIALYIKQYFPRLLSSVLRKANTKS